MTFEINDRRDTRRIVGFAMVTTEGKILETDSHITQDVIETLFSMLRVIHDISDETKTKIQSIKMDGDILDKTYRLLIYPVSERVYGVMLIKITLEEEFIPEESELIILKRSLEASLKENSEPILFKAGENSGRACVQYFKNSSISNEEAVKGVSALLNTFEIIDIIWDIQEDVITAEVCNSWENRVIKGKAKKPSCYHTKGLISGIIKEALMRSGSVEEIECIGAGDKSCKFIFH